MTLYRSFCSHVARESIKLILIKFPKSLWTNINSLCYESVLVWWWHPGTEYALCGRVNDRPVYVGIVVNRVALGHFFLQVLLISTVSSIQPRQHTHVHLNFSYSLQILLLLKRRDNPPGALASPVIRLQVFLSAASLLHPLIFSSDKESLMISFLVFQRVSFQRIFHPVLYLVFCNYLFEMEPTWCNLSKNS